MAPHPEPHKPVYTPCRHECKRGCGIYEIRPKSCRDFQCGWLATQAWDEDRRMEKYLRPDRCGVVLEVNSKGCIVAHCEKGEEWMTRPMYDILRGYAQRTQVLVGHHESYSLLKADGSLQELVRIGVDPSGEVMYVTKTQYPEYLRRKKNNEPV